MTLLPSSKSNRTILVAVFLSLVWLYGSAILSGTFGELGKDPDDIIRYIQIRDWMNGQSWFDTDQYRLGVASGTDMHWSRLPDVPVAALALFFDLFMSEERAIHVAAAVWSPLIGAILLVVLARGAEKLSSSETRFWAVLAASGLGLVFITRSSRFASGALDHHNWQMLLMIGTVVALFTVSRFKNGLIAGVAMGTALAIGPEVYPFIALIGLFVASDWAFHGEARRERTLGFGLGFALSLMSLFVLTVAPLKWGVSYCDQLSAVNVLAGIVAGLGLALVAWKTSSYSMRIRIIPLGVLGVAVLTLIGSIAPQCLGNPLDDLPEIMHTFWLDHISEAKPLVADEPNLFGEISYYIGTTIVMIIVLMWSILKRGASSPKILLLLLLLASLLMTIYQVRFYIFAQLFAIVPSAIWIANCYVSGKQKQNNIAYLGAIILSTPIFLTLPAMLLNLMNVEEEAGVKGKEKVVCVSDDVLDEFNNLSKGLILTSASQGADLLKNTEHRVLSANYHRNVAGIQAGIEISKATLEPSRHLINTYGVDYIMTCETDYLNNVYEKEFPNSLIAKINSGDAPSWLVPIGENLSDGNVKLYRISP